MPNFEVRAAWLRDCGVARLLGCVAAVLLGFVDYQIRLVSSDS